jgi:hypothetical protein
MMPGINLMSPINEPFSKMGMEAMTVKAKNPIFFYQKQGVKSDYKAA